MSSVSFLNFLSIFTTLPKLFWKFFSFSWSRLVILSVILCFILSISSLSLPAFARGSINGLPDANDVCVEGGQAGNCGFVQKSDNIATLAANFAQIMTYIIGSIAIVFILYGAFQWMIDPEKGAAQGKKIIVNALIALVISVAAYGLVATVLQFLNTTSVGGDGSQSQQGGGNTQQTTQGGSNNGGNTTNTGNNNTQNQTNQNNQNNQQPVSQTTRPIQTNNPQNNNQNNNNNTNQNNNQTQSSPPEKAPNTNQTNPSLEFNLPVLGPPQAPKIN